MSEEIVTTQSYGTTRQPRLICMSVAEMQSNGMLGTRGNPDDRRSGTRHKRSTQLIIRNVRIALVCSARDSHG